MKTERFYETLRKLHDILEEYIYTELDAAIWQLKQAVDQKRTQLKKQFTPPKPRKLTQKEKRELR